MPSHSKEYLQELIARVVGRKAGIDEQELLHELLNGQNARELTQLISEHLSTSEKPVTDDPGKDFNYWENLANNVLAVDRSMMSGEKDAAIISSPLPPVIRIHSPKTVWFRYAAAAVLIFIACGIGLIVSKDKENQTTKGISKRVPHEILPGANRAVLKLANGQEIFLDSIQGHIVSNRQFIVDNNSGKLNYEGKAEIAEYHTLSVPRSGQYQLQLPDGSEVWLNAASRITYPTRFTGANRKVTIAGEAYFEVAKNKSMPFIVDVNGKASVEVLGTSFNVNAYEDEPGINTTLLDGSIKTMIPQQAMILKPGQQAQISSQKIKITDNANLEMAVAWKNGSFKFDHTPIDDVLRQLSRWYDIDILFEHNIPAILFSGTIKRDLNLSQALFVLEKVGVNFKIEGKKLIVM